MDFSAGDAVHVTALGTGVILEVRNGRRYLVSIKGRAVEVRAGQLTAVAPGRAPRRAAAPAAARTTPVATRTQAPASLDLHGRTTGEAVEALDAFLNEALLASLAEVRVIHGRSGGRVKAAVHARLRALSVVRAFRVDERNAGVTLVYF
ncbi:MAG: Smr/MutS family protein [Vicinamibacterales bacterium]|nr:Smr/MutS family protein [Vicinamibacterales bacterium]